MEGSGAVCSSMCPLVAQVLSFFAAAAVVVADDAAAVVASAWRQHLQESAGATAETAVPSVVRVAVVP